MVYPDKFKNPNFLTSVMHAIAGIVYTANHESNFKYEMMMAFLVGFCGLFFQIRSWEWVVLILCIGLVLAAELFNTAIEYAVDLIAGEEYFHLAKVAKDAAAGAVLITSIVAALVGCIIFVPYVWAMIF